MKCFFIYTIEESRVHVEKKIMYQFKIKKTRAHVCIKLNLKKYLITGDIVLRSKPIFLSFAKKH